MVALEVMRADEGSRETSGSTMGDYGILLKVVLVNLLKFGETCKSP